MDITLIHVGRTPSLSQFELDQFTEHYKTDSPADVAVSSEDIPLKGSAHPNFPFMFVTERHFREVPVSGALIDIVYAGCMTNDGGFPPSSILPPSEHSSEHVVASATTYTSSLIWPVVATQPASLQFYAQRRTLSFFWTDDNTFTDEPDDPQYVTVDQVITWTLGGEQPASSIPGMVGWLLTNAFVQSITKTDVSKEIVAGRYYHITRTKIRTLLPYAPAS